MEIHLVFAFQNNQCRCHSQSVDLESWKCPGAAEGPFKWHWGFQAWILYSPMRTGAGGHGTAASASLYAVSWVRSRDCVKRSRRESGLKVHLCSQTPRARPQAWRGASSSVREDAHEE
jgi:hypothetical protein